MEHCSRTDTIQVSHIGLGLNGSNSLLFLRIDEIQLIIFLATTRFNRVQALCQLRSHFLWLNLWTKCGLECRPEQGLELVALLSSQLDVLWLNLDIELKSQPDCAS